MTYRRMLSAHLRHTRIESLVGTPPLAPGTPADAHPEDGRNLWAVLFAQKPARGDLRHRVRDGEGDAVARRAA